MIGRSDPGTGSCVRDDEVLASLENDTRLAPKIEDVTEELARQVETKRLNQLACAAPFDVTRSVRGG
ncbi:hypothetical protein AB0N89_02300 [Amycolatopsis sp. NPDC089917]|uniref:hypothetical protein n=1 Tax=Amycolatopsis sp. NPDC089917 TaxID=3155187 RepID=UPI00342998D3